MSLTLSQKLHKDRDSICRFCAAHKSIRLFGSGDTAILMVRYLRDEGIGFTDFMMTDEDAAETGDTWFDLPVTPLSRAVIAPGDGIIITSEAWMQGFVTKKLMDMGAAPSQLFQQGVYGQYTDMLEDYSRIRPGYTGAGNADGFYAHYTALDDAGKKAGTDKAAAVHNYLNKYEHYLGGLRDKELTLLELGIFDGASLNMWEAYFPKGRIIGVDFDERCASMGGGRKEVVIADLSLMDNLEKLKAYRPEIIIDDASHIWSHQIKSLVTLFPVLPHGGIFIMEDLETSFSAYRFQNYNDAPVSAYAFLSAVSRAVTGGEYFDKEASSPALALFTDEINALAAETETMTFLKGSCILVKK